MGKIAKIVLAYSGGLDTSVILKWLQENYDCEVVTFTADLGQGEELSEAREKASALGVDEIYVEDLREEFVRDYVFPMFRANAIYEGVYLLGTSIARPLIAKRQIEIAVQLFQKMGIERDDKQGRQDWVLRGFRQFDAPFCIVVTFDRELLDDDISKFDCGGIVNGLVNAGWSKGLGAVINSQGIMQSPVVREHAGIPEDQVIMICVAMGYPDDSFPANEVVSNRRPISEVATFVGFED